MIIRVGLNKSLNKFKGILNEAMTTFYEETGFFIGEICINTHKTFKESPGILQPNCTKTDAVVVTHIQVID